MPNVEGNAISLRQLASDLEQVKNHSHYLRVQYHGKSVSYEVVAKETHFLGRLRQFVTRLFDSSYNLNKGVSLLIKELDSISGSDAVQSTLLRSTVGTLQKIVTHVNSKRFFRHIDSGSLDATAQKIKSSVLQRLADNREGMLADILETGSIEEISAQYDFPIELLLPLKHWIESSPQKEALKSAAERILLCFARNESYLDLRELGLSSLPPVFEHLPFLRELFLGANQLTTLPKEIGSLASLEVLDLENNQFTVMPDEIFPLTGLKQLYLEGNQLTTLPREISNLASLEVLNLENNQFTVMPDEIFTLTGLKELSVSDNQLSEVPAKIKVLSQLERLYLDYNLLKTIPETIGDLVNLILLNLSGNLLEAIPKEIGNLRALEALDLKNNQLEFVPEEMAHLTALQEIDLRGNTLTNALPENITRLPSYQLNVALEKWIEEGFRDEENRLEAANRIGECFHMGDASLNLSELGLSSLPPVFEHLPFLRDLFLGGNQLTTLPKEIRSLASLEVLNLENNQFTVMPDEIFTLTALKELNVSNNRLSEVPAKINAFSHLERLDLSNNTLTAISDEIGDLRALNLLNLGSNQLARLPLKMGELTSLEELAIHDNEIHGFTDAEGVGDPLPVVDETLKELISLVSLQKLYISEGQEEIIPHELRDKIIVIETEGEE